MFPNSIRFRRYAGITLMDAAAAYFAVLIAAGAHSSAFHRSASWLFAVGSLIACTFIGANAISGGYQVLWRYFNLRDSVRLTIAAVTAGLALQFFGLLIPAAGIALPEVLLIPLLLLATSGSARVMRRFQFESGVTFAHTGDRPVPADDTRRILIAGAGFTGEQASRDLLRQRTSSPEIVGFLDDDPAKLGRFINGLPVVGAIGELPAFVERYAITGLLIAMPSAPHHLIRTLARRAEDLGLRVYSQNTISSLLGHSSSLRPGTVTFPEVFDVAANHSIDPDGIRAAPRVLITGGAGYVGSHLTRMMLDAGYHVCVLDSFLYGNHGLAGLEDMERLQIIHGDICSIRDVHRAMRGVDIVIALAALVGDPACNVDPQETINCNYESTKILIEAANFHGVHRLVFASSCSVYGASTADQLLTERSRLNAVSLYARTRILSENVLLDRHGSVDVVILRLATVFGLSPRMRFDLVVNTLTARAIVDGALTVFGGDQWRPNVHCRDVARAFKLAAEAPSASVAGHTFNVGSEQNNHQIADLARIVAESVGGAQINADADSPDHRDYRVSFEKIRQHLGFQPEFSVSDGACEIAAAIRSDQRLRNYRNPVFSNVLTVEHLHGRPAEAR